MAEWNVVGETPLSAAGTEKSYDTKLSPAEEQQFQTWKAKFAPRDSGADYDLRGAFKAKLEPNPQTGHWPDTFKKPNHPTFSDQSMYAKDAPEKAGRWEGEKYIPPKAAPAASPWNVVGTSETSFSDDGIRAYSGKKNVEVRYMAPDAYLSQVEPFKGEPWQDKQGKSLKASLAKGDKIEEIPTLDVTVFGGGKAGITDYDGRHRALAAKEAGITLIPVAIRRFGEKGDIKELKGMTGASLPYDFKPVAMPPTEAERSIAKGFAPGLHGETPGSVEAVGTGMMDPIHGTAQLLTHILPDAVLEGGNRLNNWLRDQGVPLAEMPTRINGNTDFTLDRYMQDRERLIATERAARGEDPDSFDTGRMIGNVVSPANLLPLNAIGRGSTLARVGGAVVGGAGAGAMQPVTGGEDFWTSKAAQTAAGAAIGGALSGGAELVSRGIQGFARFLNRNDPATLRSEAVQTVLRRFQQDAASGGPTAEQAMELAAAARGSGKPLALVDVGGENVRALAGNVARQPGPARNAIAQTLNERDAGAGERLAGDIDRGIASGSAHRTEEALTAARATAARPLYEEAFAANQSVESSTVNTVLKTPAGRQALADAQRKMQNDQTPQGRVRQGGGGGLNLRTLDYVKRSLDDQIGAALRAGERDKAGILIGLKKRFVEALDDADVTARAGPNSLKPEGGAYARARAAYSGPSQSLDALDEGERFLTRSKTPEDIAAIVRKLSPGDREFYKIGAANAMKKAVAETGAQGDEARKIVGNQYVRDKLRPLFNTDAEFTKFLDAVGMESRMFRTRQEILGGSQTAGRVAEDMGGNLSAAAHAAHGALSFSHGNYLGSLGAFFRMMRDLGLRTNHGLNSEIGRVLMADVRSMPQGPSRFLSDSSATLQQGQNFLSQIMRQGAPLLAPGVAATGTGPSGGVQ